MRNLTYLAKTIAAQYVLPAVAIASIASASCVRLPRVNYSDEYTGRAQSGVVPRDGTPSFYFRSDTPDPRNGNQSGFNVLDEGNNCPRRLLERIVDQAIRDGKELRFSGYRMPYGNDIGLNECPEIK